MSTPVTAKSVHATTKPQEEALVCMRTLQDLFEIEPLIYEDNTFKSPAAKENYNILGVSLAMRQFQCYPATIDLNLLKLKSMIKRLKDYGEVKFVYYGAQTGEEFPHCLLLKVIAQKPINDIFVWIGEISGGEFQNYPDATADDLIGDYVPLIDSGRVYFNVSNTRVLDLFNKIEEECKIIYKPSKESYVEMIIQTMQGLTTQKVKFDFNYDNDLDLHYGENFSSFHEKLMARLIGKDKGLVMFHGPPGNGKTHYIRRLLPLLNEKGKRVILIPKHILGSLESPAFNLFMLQNFVGQKIVFVMEDAESVISKRSEGGGGRSELVSTLLNITDGILNDVFNIQVILTFNTSLKEIDEALLRTGRLLAKFEFANLGRERAELLADHLGVKIKDNRESYSLAEIYGLIESLEDTEVLINQHLEKKKKALGFE